jgi:hypothetical protein
MCPEYPASTKLRRPSTRRARTLLPSVAATGACLLLTAAPAYAQGSGDGFLFRPPSGAVEIRTGFDFASAGSQVFSSFVTKDFTVDRRDFSSPPFVFDVTYRVAPRLQAVFGVSVAHVSIASEYRGFLDNNDQPIEQTTTFQRVPLTASLRYYLVDTGRPVGRFAWIPKRYAPYVGAGGGVMWYRLRLQGDFIDFNTLNVSPDLLQSDGWAPTVHAFAGTEISLSPRFAVSVEGRYQWARATLSSDFVGFDRIDLSGFALTSGLVIRY